jgi:hypothetical protein
LVNHEGETLSVVADSETAVRGMAGVITIERRCCLDRPAAAVAAGAAGPEVTRGLRP